MAAPLAVQCYQEGFTRRLQSLTAPKFARFSKRATGMAPLAERELALLGEKTFRGSFGQPDVLTGLKNIFMPRYGQVAAAHALRNNYLENILRLSKQMRSVGSANPAYGGLVKQVQNATSAFRPAQQQLFGEIGSAVKPRMDFLTKTLPLGAGLAGGGALGYGAGHFEGQGDERDRIQAVLSQVPLMTRLKYLFNPGSTFGGGQDKSSSFMGSMGGGMGGSMFKSMPRMMGGMAHSPISGFGRQMPGMMRGGLMRGGMSGGGLGGRVTQPGMFANWRNMSRGPMQLPGQMPRLPFNLSGGMR